MYGMARPRSATARSVVRGTAREAILAATLQVVAEEGVDSVTHRRVAERAGVSLGSPTHHFSGRDELIREAFRSYLLRADEALVALADAAEARGGRAISSARHILIALIEREFADPTLVRAEYELLLFASKDRELAIIVAAWEARAVGALAALLERAGSPRPTESARTLVNFVRGFELERLVKPKLGIAEFERRLTPLLRALCSEDASAGADA